MRTPVTLLLIGSVVGVGSCSKSKTDPEMLARVATMSECFPDLFAKFEVVLDAASAWRMNVNAIPADPIGLTWSELGQTYYGGSQGDNLGYSVAGVGDVDKDGHDDIIVGARVEDSGNIPNAGSARVRSGADGSLLYAFYGDWSFGQFGRAVAGAGDVNQDGYPDVIVGAFSASVNGTSSGVARVLSGQDGSILHTLYGESEGDWFGWSVAGAGDVNQDGYADVIVGSLVEDDNGIGAGGARVFSGFDGSILHTVLGDSARDQFGSSVAGVGDVDLDGHDDFIIGARGAFHNGSNPGSARVFSGVDGSILYTFYGDSDGGEFGNSVDCAGDVNRDGYPDFLIGAPDDHSSGVNSGSARVLSGADGSTIYTVPWRLKRPPWGLRRWRRGCEP